MVKTDFACMSIVKVAQHRWMPKIA